MQVDRIIGDEDWEMQSLIRPEEDRRRLHSDRPWQGGFRWFRSANVICLEHYAPKRSKTPPRATTLRGAPARDAVLDALHQLDAKTSPAEAAPHENHPAK
jgi:hypothetical protein